VRCRGQSGARGRRQVELFAVVGPLPSLRCLRQNAGVATIDLKAIDFCCGAGGLTRGMLDSGISVVAGVDNDPRLRDTYAKNNRPSKFVCDDITKIDIRELRSDVGITKRDKVVYAACTPCQPFSTLNQRRGADDRKYLLLAFADIIAEAPPDYIAVENVPGLNTAYGREIYEQFTDRLQGVGFGCIAAEMLDAKDFGVPQVRRRFILLAARKGEICLPTPNTGVPATVRRALANMPDVVFADEDRKPLLPNHVARRPQAKHIAILRQVPKDGGSRSDVSDRSVLLKCHQDHPSYVHRDVFGRMSWDAPAPTLTARCTDVYCGRFGHPTEDRGLSVREAASLQSFGRRYRFYGDSLFHLAAQVGNAVPVRLARRLGEQIVAAAG
jgi:DNA (cytosine-5)-methyltransferase 1